MKLRLAAALALVSALAGCQSAWTQRPERPHAHLVPGETTWQEAVDALGPPQVVRVRGDKTVLTWSLRHAEGSGVGLGSLLLNFSTGETAVANEKLDVVIDAAGRVSFVRMGGLSSVERPGPWPFGE